MTGVVVRLKVIQINNIMKCNLSSYLLIINVNDTHWITILTLFSFLLLLILHIVYSSIFGYEMVSMPSFLNVTNQLSLFEYY